MPCATMPTPNGPIVTISKPGTEVPLAENKGTLSKPGYRRSWATIFGVLLVPFVLASVLGCDADDTTTAPDDPTGDTSPEPPSPQATLEPVPQDVEQEPPTIGDEARDGDFTFVVSEVEDGPAIIGDADFGIEPQGRFVFVTMTVTNHGDAPGSFFGDNQYLIDTEGRRASADGEAAIHLDEAQSLYEEINPGNSLTGIVVFDIPVDAVPAGVELHDSVFSDGVTVVLG